MSKEKPLILLYDKVLEEKRRELDYVMGRILTIIDASFTDPEQRKAVKDLVKDARYDYRSDNIHWNFEKFGEALKIEFFSKDVSLVPIDAVNPYK